MKPYLKNFHIDSVHVDHQSHEGVRYLRLTVEYGTSRCWGRLLRDVLLGIKR